jgi:hypothetical protein
VPRTRSNIGRQSTSRRSASLRDLRLRRGITQADLALVAALAKVLKVSADEVLGLEPSKENGHVKDRRFVRRLDRIDRLSKRDRQTLVGTIDAFLAKLHE